MLHTQTVAPQTLGLLKQLEAEPRLAAFNLAGGTALALYLGHRVSVDLDLFTPESFDAGELEAFLSQRYGFQTAFRRPDTLKGMIDGVKIDCIAHKYAYLRQPYAESGIRLYSIEDIVAMKLSAIADDGSRLKDFVDIACLSTRIPFYEMLKCYERKFPQANVIRPFKALTYFDDIDFGEDIVMETDRPTTERDDSPPRAYFFAVAVKRTETSRSGGQGYDLYETGSEEMNPYPC